MKPIAKFIINRNDLEYYYVEKVQDNKDIFYYVYSDMNTRSLFNQDSFHAIFGLDEKLSVNNYIHRMRYSEELSFGFEEYNKIDRIVDSINKSTISSKNKKNPTINVMELMSYMDICNGLIIEKESLVDYEANYDLVRKQGKHTETHDFVSSRHIKEPVFAGLNEQSLDTGIERVRKYDN